MRLNKQDGGSRQCISVTNNEVSADEHKGLREQNLRAGTTCDYIQSRVETIMDGRQTHQGGTSSVEFPCPRDSRRMLSFSRSPMTPLAVSYQTAFARIAPLLWLRAGSLGQRIDRLPTDGWEVADAYGLLIELDRATDFLKAVRKAKELRVAYIVTDDDDVFSRSPDAYQRESRQCGSESYLTNFAFANGDDA